MILKRAQGKTAEKVGNIDHLGGYDCDVGGNMTTKTIVMRQQGTQYWKQRNATVTL